MDPSIIGQLFLLVIFFSGLLLFLRHGGLINLMQSGWSRSFSTKVTCEPNGCQVEPHLLFPLLEVRPQELLWFLPVVGRSNSDLGGRNISSNSVGRHLRYTGKDTVLSCWEIVVVYEDRNGVGKE